LCLGVQVMSEDYPVSVIVCTLNRAELLSRIIDLLRAQNYSKDKYEIIVVDNGSTDNTRSVVESFMGPSSPMLRYVFESRLGVTFARNRGFEVAINPYLAYIDDDCTVGLDWLRSLMSGYDLNEDIFAVFGQIINDWGDQIKPRWMMTATEKWLGNNNFLGSSPRILDSSHGTREGNLSIKKEALRSFGGFFGMEQFGSRNMASGELKYCLFQAKKRGAKIAYVPGAIAIHHVVVKSRSWMLQRAYWQGITDGLFDYLLTKREFWSLLFRAYFDSVAMIVLFGHSLFFMFLFDQPKCMFHLLRAVRRLGLILSELHLKGNWPRVNSWLREHAS